MSAPAEILVDGVRYVPDPQQATRVSIWGMYEAHLFHRIKGSTVDEVIDNWLRHNRMKHPANINGHRCDDLGPSMLCPATVLQGDRELRRVGKMVFPERNDSFEHDLEEYRAALKADPDIERLLASPSGDKSE